MKVPKITPLIFLFVSSLSSQSQQPAPFAPIPAGTSTASLGSFLEKPFQLQLGYCITGTETPKTLILKKTLSHDRELSAIPPQLNDPSLTLASNVVFNNNSSVGRAFGYVYSSKSIVQPNIDGNNFLLIDYLEDPQLMTLSGLNKAIYDYSCSSSIAASMNLNTGWTFPIAQIASAIQADSSKKTSYHLALVSGTFYSPFWAFYNSSVSQDWKTYAQLLAWEWYTRHPGAARDGAQRFALTQFDGVALYKVTTNVFAVDGKADANATLSTPAIKISGALQTSYNSSEQATVDSYALAVRQISQGQESDHFEPFPSLASLSTQISAHAHLDTKSTDQRLQQVPTSHDQIITGVPPIVCSSNWRAEASAGANLGGVLKPVSSTPIPSTDSTVPPSCRITVLYTPDQPTQGQSWPTHVTLNYLLESDIFDPNSSTPNTAIGTAKFQADQVSLSASGLPVVQPTSSLGASDAGFPRTSSAGGITFFSYQWSYAFSVQEDTVASEKISTVAPALSDISFSCGSSGDRKIAPVMGNVTYTAPTLNVVILHNSDSTKEQLSTTQSDICMLGGRATFTLANGVSVVRDLPATQIIYPKAAAPVPLAPPPVPPSPAQPTATPNPTPSGT